MGALVFGSWKTKFGRVVQNDNTKKLTTRLLKKKVFRASETVKVAKKSEKIVTCTYKREYIYKRANRAFVGMVMTHMIINMQLQVHTSGFEEEEDMMR